MSIYFKPYEGSKPFLFISYPHSASEQVVGTMKVLHDRGYRIWYDEGIPAGSDWPGNIAQHMNGCSAVIFFQTQKSLSSPNCFSEMRTAVRAKKPLLVIPLDDSVPEGDWEPLLASAPQLQGALPGSELAQALLDSGFISRRYRRTVGEKLHWNRLAYAASVLLLLGSAALFASAGGLFDRYLPDATAADLTPAPIIETEEPELIDLPEAEKYFSVSFPDSQQKTAVQEALDSESGVLRWQLGQITSLSAAGSLTGVSSEDISFTADGTCLVNGAPMLLGKISDLSYFADMLRLEELTLVSQPLASLAPLNGLVLLRELNLAGSTVSELSELRELPSLAVLHLEHCSVRDLTPLEALPSLRTVYVSGDMLPLHWNENSSFEVVLVRDTIR